MGLLSTLKNQLPCTVGYAETSFEHILGKFPREGPEPDRGSKRTVFRNSPVDALTFETEPRLARNDLAEDAERHHGCPTPAICHHRRAIPLAIIGIGGAGIADQR